MNLKSFFRNTLISLPAWFICFLLILPFLLFSFHLKDISWPEGSAFFSIFFGTFFQAFISASLSLVLGMLGSLGLICLSQKRYYFLIEGLVLLPCLIPPLLLVLSLLHLIEQIGTFPFSLFTLIFAQVLTYTGLCSVAFTRVFLRFSSDLSEWAYLQGSSSWLFLKTLVKTILRKDIKIFFVLIFVSTFTSLSLPLLTAGSSAFSLEFFIYEKLKDPNLWPQALGLILFQSLFIFFICLKAFSDQINTDISFLDKKIQILPKKIFCIIPFGMSFLSFGGLFFISDLRVFKEIYLLKSILFSAVLSSLILSLAVGLLTLIGLVFMSLSFESKKARKFVVSFMPPGISFMGFAFLLLPLYGEFFVFFKWILGLSLLLFPLIYRFRGERTLEQLTSQVETARFLGANSGLIFHKILWPQNRSPFFLCAGMASFWACGDFAYSLIVSSGYWNLSLLVYDFFSSYRFDEAILFSWILLLLSFFVLFFWLGVAYVFDKKSIL